MKKIIKIALVGFMLLGIFFSISNFISVELQSGNGLKGAWIAENVCGGSGNQCDLPFM